MRTALLLLPLAVALACKSDPKPDAQKPAESGVPSPSASASSAPTEPGAGPAPSTDRITRLAAKTEADEQLGYEVAISGDRIAATCFKRKGAGDTTPGSVFVFQKKGAGFELETELKAEKSHQLGNVVAFEGDTLLVGAMYDDGKTKEAGAAYVFTRTDAGWDKGTKLSANGGQKDDAFGMGVAILGKSLAVSNNREKGGSLFVFEPGKKAGFTLAQTIPAPEDNGPAEAVTGQGDFVAIGSQFAGKLNEQGVVNVFRRGEKGGFKRTETLIESGSATEQHFGGGLTLSGRTLVVSSEKQVTVFDEADGKFVESARITPPVTTGLADANFALKGDLLAIGLPREAEGRVLLYRKNGKNWQLERTLGAPDGKKDDWFGYSVAFCSRVLVIGSPFKDDNAGEVYVAQI
jgi:hypothetical protein